MTDHVELQALHNPVDRAAGDDGSLPSEDTLKVNANLETVAISSGAQSLTQRDEDASWRPGRAEILIVVLLAVLNLMIALDATIVVPALPKIAKSIRANSVQAFWVGTAYLLPYGVVQPLAQYCSDTFSRLTVLLFGTVWFTAGSILCAVSKNVPWMLSGRVIQGVGGGSIVCLTQVIFTDIFPLAQRPKWAAVLQLTWAIGLVIGPLIGGALTKADWRWLFWLNMPFCGLGLVAAPFVVKLQRVQKLTFVQAITTFDWIGAVLFTGGVTVFLIGLSFGGQLFSWYAYQTLLPLVLGAVATVVALVYEARYAQRPVLRLSIFHNYSCACLLIAQLLQGFMLYLSLYIWNLYFQGVKARSAIGTGVALLPVMLVTIPSSIIAGRIIGETGKYRTVLVTAWSVITLGSVLCILWTAKGPRASTPLWAATQLIFGAGQGIHLIAGTIALQSHVAAEDVAEAAAFNSFLRGTGMSFGVSIGGTIFQNRLAYWLGEGGLDEEIATNIEAYLETLNSLPDSQAAYIDTVRNAIALANRNVFEVCTAVSAVVVLLMIATREVHLNQKLASRHVIIEEKQAIVKDVELPSV